MADQEPSTPSPPGIVSALILVGLGVSVYWNSFDVPFLWDDTDSIVENRFLEEDSLWAAMEAPARSPLSGRPLVALSFALNYKFGERQPFGYHVGNLIIHILCALLLFDLLRQLLRRPGPWPPGRGGWIALMVSALWIVHPVLTEAVTYVTQRTELLASLFILATLWGAARSWDSARTSTWIIITITASMLGALSKEIVVATPLLVVLMDRAFRFDSFREAFRARKGLYIGVFLSWVVLFTLVAQGARSDSVGFGMGLSPFEYALRQCGVIAHYLKVSMVPTNLCFDHGENYQPGWLRIAAGMVLLLPILAAASLPWRTKARGRLALGFAACVFLFILAPTSSVLPIVSEIAAERRMYLPLAALLAAIGTVAATLPRPRIVLVISMLLVPTFATLAVMRNRDYVSEENIWRDTLAKAPDNARAIQNIGVIHFRRGQFDEALAAFQKILKTDPGHPHANVGVGTLLVENGQYRKAIEYLERGLRVIPDHAVARNSLGVALLEIGEVDRALTEIEEAVRIRPQDAESWNSLGSAYSIAATRSENPGDTASYKRQAIQKFERAIQLDENYAEAHANLGRAHVAIGDRERGLELLEKALSLDATLHSTKRSVADMRFRARNYEGARELYESLLKSTPDEPDLLVNYGTTLIRLGARKDALIQYERAVRADPNHTTALRYAGILFRDDGNLDKAKAAFGRLVELDRNDEASHMALAQIHDTLGDSAKARYHAREVLRINPTSVAARSILEKHAD